MWGLFKDDTYTVTGSADDVGSPVESTSGYVPTLPLGRYDPSVGDEFDESWDLWDAAANQTDGKWSTALSEADRSRIGANKAAAMEKMCCPALANTLGCWSYLEILQAVESQTTKDYEVELDRDGGFVRIINMGRGGVWTEEADGEFDEFNSRKMVSCPFPNVETARYIMRYIDDNKFTTVSWLAESVRLWMSCWWKEHLGLDSTWEMPEISSMTETDNYGGGRGGLVYSEPAHRRTKWMDYRSGMDRGVKTVEPIVASGKVKRIPHWESFNERSMLRGIITTRTTQIAATCGTNQAHWADSVTELLVQLSRRSVPRSWTCNVMESWLLSREAATTASVAGENATFSGGAQLVIVDHFEDCCPEPRRYHGKTTWDDEGPAGESVRKGPDFRCRS